MNKLIININYSKGFLRGTTKKRRLVNRPVINSFLRNSYSWESLIGTRHALNVGYGILRTSYEKSLTKVMETIYFKHYYYLIKSSPRALQG